MACGPEGQTTHSQVRWSGPPFCMAVRTEAGDPYAGPYRWFGLLWCGGLHCFQTVSTLGDGVTTNPCLAYENASLGCGSWAVFLGSPCPTDTPPEGYCVACAPRSWELLPEPGGVTWLAQGQQGRKSRWSTRREQKGWREGTSEGLGSEGSSPQDGV